MNIIFFGTSKFAVPSLECLARPGNKILAVVTQPDRKKGRLLRPSYPAIKDCALKLGLEIFQPEPNGLNDIGFIEKLKSKKPDLFVVVSYGNILKKQVLQIPSKFCINLHGSLLPKYRGAAPVNWTIINGDQITGVTVIKMNERMDEGDIIIKKQVPVLTMDTSESLSTRLSSEGSQLLLEAVYLIEKNSFELEKQDDSQATYAPKLKKQDGLINWNKPALEVENHIRGVQPWPGAYTYLGGKLIKILKVGIYGSKSSSKPGEIIGIEKDGILVSAGSGAIVIEELQPESSKRMDVTAFLAGHKVKAGDVFSV